MAVKHGPRWFAAGLVAALVFGGVPAHADDPALAEELFMLGQDLFDRGEIDEACAKFEASLRAEWGAGTLINLARCHETQGRSATAWAEYREVADKAAKLGQTARAEQAAELADRLEPQLARLQVDVPSPVPGLVIERSGVPIADGALGVATPIDPGTHEIVAKADGYETHTTEITIAASETQRIEIPPLVPLPAPAPKPAAPTRTPASNDGLMIAGIAIGSVGVATAAVGGVFGALTLSEVSDAESDDALCGTDKLCTDEGTEVIDGAETKGIVSTILLAGGAIATGVGVTLIILSQDETSDDTVGSGFETNVSLGLGGFNLRGTF